MKASPLGLGQCTLHTLTHDPGSGPVTIYCRLTAANELRGGHILQNQVMADLVESSEQGWPYVQAELMAANTLQFEKHLKAPPLPKYLLYQPAKARSSSPIWLKIPAIRFTAFAVRPGNHFWWRHEICMLLGKVRKLEQKSLPLHRINLLVIKVIKCYLRKLSLGLC